MDIPSMHWSRPMPKLRGMVACAYDNFVGGNAPNNWPAGVFLLTLAVGASNRQKNSSSTFTRPGQVWSSTHLVTLEL